MAQTTPISGHDAAGADAYAQVIAAPTGNKRYPNLIAYCATKDAMLSLDAGTTDHIRVPTGVRVQLDGLDIGAAIHAKNAVAGQNYATLTVIVW